MWAILGSLGVWMMELSYIPQLIRLYQMKEAEEFSLLFPLLNLTGRLLVMSYMISIGQAILGLGFLAGILLRSTLLFQVLYYRRYRREAIFASAAEPPAAISDEDKEERSRLVTGGLESSSRDILTHPPLIARFSSLDLQTHLPGDTALLATPSSLPWRRE